MDSLNRSARKKVEKSGIFFKKALKFSLLWIVFSLKVVAEPNWGFWAHKRINRLAVFRLPAAMQIFYKKHIDYLTENAVNPDRRRYAVIGEAERHFIDLDVYGDTAMTLLPRHWHTAVLKMGEDSLRKHGIVPWYIQTAASQLTSAFREKNASRIMRISADLGHYIADAHVPLHTTRNYNGQLTGQVGIHGFWESRLPELFANEYDLWLGQAVYLPDISEVVWKAVRDSHSAKDSVLDFEKQLTEGFSAEQKYAYELRNNVLTRMHSTEFSAHYHRMLAGQVEKRMRASVQMVGDIWYTCWINAGQPDLSTLGETRPDLQREDAEQNGWLRRLFKIRPEADD